MKLSSAVALLAGACVALAQDFNASALAELIVQDIEHAADCSSCEGILTSLKGAAILGDGFFDSVLIDVCKLSGAEDPDVCTGVVNAEGPIIAYALRNMTIGSHTSTLLCANLLGLCEYPAVRPYNVTLPAPKKHRMRPEPSSRDPIHVVHISDTHVDLSYETGSNYNCTKPICCRPYTAEDAPGNTSYPAGPYGNPLCDAPLRLEESMFKAINEHFPKAAFTIFTGDVVAHDVWLVNRSEVLKDLDVTFTHMEDLRLAYPAVGNHDTAPVNAFPPQGLADYKQYNPQWTYNKLATIWKKWIGASAAKSADDYGSYSVLYPGTKLRVISFNSIFYYTLNFWMYEDPMEFDPNGQFQWFVKELQAAETAGERVWLLAHVPSGSSDFFQDYSNYFSQIIMRYHATIAATFYGHTHQDQFEVAYSNYTHRNFKTAKMVSYIAPSLTPTSGSPSFRVYSVDPETFAVIDYTQFIANMSSPEYQKGPTWHKYYSAKEIYARYLDPAATDPHAELSPAFWHNVTKVFVEDDAVFQAYYSRKSRGYSKETCTDDCKKSEICSIRAANSEYNCATTTPGLQFNKRDGMLHDYRHHGHEDECGESRLRSIFGNILRSDQERLGTLRLSKRDSVPSSIDL